MKHPNRTLTIPLSLVGVIAICSTWIGCKNGDTKPPKQVITPIAYSSTPLVSSPFKETESKESEKFTLIPTEHSGLDFVNDWSPDSANGSIDASFVATSGTAVGDFNNDGLPDIFATKRDGGGALFQNMGGLKFKDVTQEQKIDVADMWGTGCTFVDINDDGRLDLYVCAYKSDNKLFINLGNHFEEQTKKYGLDFNGSSTVMTFADYDRDGDLDAYLLTDRMSNMPPPHRSYMVPKKKKPYIPDELAETVSYAFNPETEMWMPVPTGQFDYFFRNDDGHFVDATFESGIETVPFMGLSAVWWDFNEDGWPDLYVSNDFMGHDHLYRNNGPNQDGVVTFTDIAKTSLPHTPWFSMGSEAVDLNNDGLLDFMASDMAGTNHYRDKLSMGAMSGPGSNAWFLNAPDPPQYMRNAVYVNTGTERFMEVAHMCGLASSDWTWSVRFSDFDQDGFQDVYITNGMSRDWFNGDLLAQAAEVRMKEGDKGRRKFWNQQPMFKLENLAFRNKGNLKFENVSNNWGLGHLGVSSGTSTGDFDLDGDLDLVVAGFNEPLRLYQNNVASGNAIQIKLDGRASNRQGVGTKLTIETESGETMVRYATTNHGFMSCSEPIHHFGLGQAETIAKLTLQWPSGQIQEFTDLATNHVYTATEPDQPIKTFKPIESAPSKSMFVSADKVPDELVHSEKPYDDFMRQPLLPNKYSQLGPAISWGDVDADGDLDCFTGGSTGNPAILSLNQNGALTPSPLECFEADKKHEDMGAIFFDVDQDNDLDLYVVSGGVECEPESAVLQDRIYLNDGKGKFTRDKKMLPKLLSSGGPVSAADFDRDGDIDLFVGGRIVPGQYPAPPQSAILINENGKFIDQTNEICSSLAYAGMATSSLWTDVNNDGWIDLLVTYEWDSVRVFQNKEGKLTDVSDSTDLAKHLGWFNSSQGGDIDGDGDMDYVIGNFGLNSKYKASPKKPQMMFYGDFDGNGKMNIVEAKFEGDSLLPHRGLGCTSDAMPIFKERTETFDAFATSTLSELYTEEKLDTSLKLEANQLESLVLINNSTSDEIKFDIRTLPRSVQTSSVFGLSLTDVDGDNHLDLYLVQNFYGPQRETGYVDGGVSALLKGDGHGGFQPIRSDTSGLVVAGDAKSLTTLDLNSDHRPDFMAGINSKKPLVFVNQNEYQGSVIKILGKQTVGTKVILNWENGSQRAHEIYSSAGYLSQSTPDIFIGEEKPISAKLIGPDGKESTHKLEFKDGICQISVPNQ